MSDTKISEAVAVAAGISQYGVLECHLLPGGLEQLQATGGDAKLYLHPQPAELAEQQGSWSNVAEEMAHSEMHAVVQRAGGYRNGLLGEMLSAGMRALAATGKQQVGEVQVAAREAIDARFRSGNSIPVERASVPREEWESLKAALTARQPGAQVPAAYRTFSERMRTIVSVEDFGGNPDRMHEMAKECGWTPLCEAPPAQSIDLGRVQALIEKWEAIADKHGVRQFTGNDHRLFANELRVAIGHRDAAPGVGS